jgi:hypothetical protein
MYFKTHPHIEYKSRQHIPKHMTLIQSKMTCLSPRTILLQRTIPNNLKFQYTCKIQARGLGYFHDIYSQRHKISMDTTLRAQNPSIFFYNEAYCRSRKCNQEEKNRH